ncbi:proenkephalin-A [Patagioenas fasciata monilis]|uniref:Proenkephalin-A n=2 Tax=Patagioenas fasciata TaxID=372321 RepID=A0A1V4KGC0_PATFA|nr:proenkephalin-A [Patagioenas fasciata monilis]
MQGEDQDETKGSNDRKYGEADEPKSAEYLQHFQQRLFSLTINKSGSDAEAPARRSSTLQQLPGAPRGACISMALLLRLGCSLLALSTCLLPRVRADCGRDCAACAYRLGPRAGIHPLACTLECEGKLPSAKAWETCKDLLQLAKLDLSEDGNIAPGDKKELDENHLLAKKYGGFMKRYGGFMKKMDELYRVEPEDEANGGEILAKRYGGFMKKDSDDDALANSSDLLKELLGDNPEVGHYREINENDGDVSKRYGGFMRSIKRSPELEDEAKELQKRYGGFMRRVGRPEWWLDYQKRYGGFLKRFADSILPSEEDGETYSKEVPEMEKRYGGFMRF